MGISKYYIILIVLACYVIVYISLRLIINYYYPNKSIYLNMYSIYYLCFIITLLFATSNNYYINAININSIIPSILSSSSPESLLPESPLPESPLPESPLPESPLPESPLPLPETNSLRLSSIEEEKSL